MTKESLIALLNELPAGTPVKIVNWKLNLAYEPEYGDGDLGVYDEYDLAYFDKELDVPFAAIVFDDPDIDLDDEPIDDFFNLN